MDLEALVVAEQLLHFSHPLMTTPLDATANVGDWDKCEASAMTFKHEIVRPATPPWAAAKVTGGVLADNGVRTTSCGAERLISTCVDQLVPPRAPKELLRQHQTRFRRVRKRWHVWHLDKLKRLSRFLPSQRRPRRRKHALKPSPKSP
ncbi:hypothetical protein SPRG_02296 [Saprolegnia parasitica CBS 223.65]|uniref:Uncharacterized protein n=1 Tax=Saprolegnia parasitica (strain CBS 223.65) TaxID=695850 RepID=A0A067CSI1_SAPPC|nr:hypothetical protein SPRG_02296 [Saprolegnia parasitica CBS 223.65]KDO33488.1 hypothetical protein SPRG_02296 [Saprolegnia parasitica CBS 223.65]|eukprot:XP_012196232.1 hypothetical protein SPRG_02296 [Saprolegnia parasitica CBS 223.65]